MLPDPFAAHRPRLLGVAYGIVGELAEAEDVVQDAWLRWQAADQEAVRDATGFLITTTTRLAIDRLRSARARRERYVGTWLPDPLVREVGGAATSGAPHARSTAPGDAVGGPIGSATTSPGNAVGSPIGSASAAPDPAEVAIEAEQLSFALLVALERLNPVERAVLVLRDAFDLEYAEIADAIDVSPANARQIAKRARDRVGDAGRRQPVAREEQERLTVAFLAAAHAGDVGALRDLLAADAVQWSDGGGHGNMARRPVEGAERIARLYAGIHRTGAMPADLVPAFVLVNGELGVRLTHRTTGLPYAITVLEIADARIAAVRNFANPERLAR